MIERAAFQEVLACLSDTPVTLIHGPRQSGKSTLALEAGKRVGAKYVSFDDPAPRAFAERDPAGFLLSQPGPLIIDEVQRVPGIFLALKSEVDRDRRPGRYLLTGSANVLSLPKMSDSLAGRIAILDLLPLSQAEIEDARTNFVDQVFSSSLELAEGSDDDLVGRVVKGGFPEPFARASAARRNAWFGDYVRTLLERDVRDLANIEGLSQLPRVLKLLAARSGAAINVVELSRETQIPNTSLHRYLELLRAVFLTCEIPAWSTDQSARLTKSPRTFLVDSGLLCYLLNLSEASFLRDAEALQPVLRNFVAMELKKLAGVSLVRPNLMHLRTVRRLEVDFVLEDRAGQVVGIQVKAGRTIVPSDQEGLEFLAELSGERFVRGVILYQGDEVMPLSRSISAVPISSLWAK